MNRHSLLLPPLLLLAACGRQPVEETPPVPVTVMVAGPDVISRMVQAPCRLQAGNEAVVAVVNPSRIEEVLVTEGDRVSGGELLARLSSDDVHGSSVNSAAAAVGAARAAAEYSGENLARTRELFEAGALSSSDYESAVAADESARAALGRAWAGYTSAEAAGSSGQVTAPFDGVVTRVWARTGNMASGPLMTVAGDGVLRAELLVSERHLPLLRDGLPAFYSTAHFPGEVFPGSVVSVSASVDPVSGLVPLVVQLSDTTGRLVPGLSGMMTVSLETADSVVVLPGRALRPVGDGAWEAVLVSAGSAELRAVETGIRQGNSWEIVSGVEFGDSVVVLGNHLVDEGSAVTAVDR
jgi:RND family efflux transporter MFP subunit